MAFMKRSVNLFLIVLIVLAISVIAGLTVYYQEGFRNLSDTYLTTNTNLTTCVTDLAGARSELAAAQLAITANKEDVEKTVGLFSDKQAELEATQDSLDEANKRITSLQAQIKTKDSTIATLNSDIAKLNTQITALQNEVNDLEDELDACYDSG